MQRTIIHVWPCLNDSPPVNVFRTDDTKAAAFAETKQTETMWQKVYENYKLNSWEPESKEFWPHGLIKLFCHLECFFPREANFGGFNGSAILLHSNSQGNLKWYFEPSFALTKFCQNVGNGISGNLGFTAYQGLRGGGERTPAVLKATFPVSELPGSATFCHWTLKILFP